MATDNNHRSVNVERTSSGRFTISNERGGEITIGTGDDADFTPTELLLGAIGGCTAIDVDVFTSRRSEPDRFLVVADGDKIRDGNGNRLTHLQVTFDLAFPDDAGGDAARALLPDAVQKSHDRLCTVGRTVELGTPVTTKIR
jgi:putative redox protein